MEQLRLLDLAEPTDDDRPAKRRAPRPRRQKTDWRLDPSLRLLGRRKVLEARRILDETRQAHLAEAS